jgi:hypothetical protein
VTKTTSEEEEIKPIDYYLMQVIDKDCDTPSRLSIKPAMDTENDLLGLQLGNDVKIEEGDKETLDCDHIHNLNSSSAIKVKLSDPLTLKITKIDSILE